MSAARRGATALLGALYLLSGATGLCYEILWARMLSVRLGTSVHGIAATVAAFMLGLGIGALAGTRWGARLAPQRALQFFALLELTVAAYALLLPAIASGGAAMLDRAAATLAPWQWGTLQALFALALLGLPATAMGAGFPAVIRAWPRSPGLAGRLYGLNCLGAAGGALACLGLLATLGWPNALRAVALLGASIAGAAWLLQRTLHEHGTNGLPRSIAASPAIRAAEAAGTADTERTRAAPPRRGAAMLLAYAGVGAMAITLELGWTRLYGIVLLRTEYVLALILAVYLAGTALGSLAAARVRAAAAQTAAPTIISALVPLAACGFTLLGLWTLPSVSVWLGQVQFPSLPVALACQALALTAFTLPVTAALGAWLPLLAARGSPSTPTGDLWAARLYGANCLGGGVGALFTVLVAIPALGSAATIAAAAVLLLALGPTLTRPRIVVAALPLALFAAWQLRALPAPARMLPAQAMLGEERYRYEDALSLNDVTEMPDGQRILMTDLQRLDASSDPSAARIQANQSRLPLLLHPHPRSVLFLGLGTGISAGGSIAFPDLERTAVEISPGAIAAARTWFAPVNGGVMDAMTVQADDARHFLLAHPRRYDVIVGDLFHPDLAGMGYLLCVEQFERVRAHLNDDGIFAQWLAVNQFDTASLETVLRSFARVFPRGQLFLDGMHLALVGSPAALRDGPAVAAHMAALSAAQRQQVTGEEGEATWLGRYWGPIPETDGAVQSESRPVIEFRLPQLPYREVAPLAGVLRELLRERPGLDAASAQLDIGAQQRSDFAGAYIATGLAVQSWLAVLDADRPRARELMRLAYESNPRDAWIAGDLADEMFTQAQDDGSLGEPGVLERILRIFPQHAEALRALWHRESAAGRGNSAGPGAAALARLRSVAPLDREAALGGRGHK